MRHVNDLAVGEEPEVGRVYLVPCLDMTTVKLRGRHVQRSTQMIGMLTSVPVVGIPHVDDEFHNFAGRHLHWHVDIRFMQAIHFSTWGFHESDVNSSNGKFPVVPVSDLGFEVPTPFAAAKRCRRRIADLRGRILDDKESYGKFEAAMAQHTIDPANPICPHHGTDLHGQPIHNGVITCPLHASNWCARTGRFIPKNELPRDANDNILHPDTVRCG